MGALKSSKNLGPTQAKYSDESVLVQFANRRFFQALHEMLDGVAARSILDAGSGEGQIMGQLDGSRIVGVDIDLARARMATLRDPAARVGAADVQVLPFPSESFDLVLVLEVFEHVGDPTAALAEVARVSRRYLLASVPNEPWWRMGNMLRLKYLRDFGNTPEHIHHWSARGFKRFISSSFKVVELRKPFLWTFILAEKIPGRS